MNNLPKYLFNVFFYILIIVLLTAFNFRDVIVGTWNPQYIYNTNGQSIKDIAFADSLSGYITLRSNITGGTILRTANGGNNWYINYPSSDSGLFSNIKLFYKDSCLICNAYRLFKTTNEE